MSAFVRALLKHSSLLKNGTQGLRGTAVEFCIRSVTTMQDVKAGLIELMGLERGYRPLLESRDYLMTYLPKAQEELPPRSMQDSFCEAIIPLTTEVMLQEKYVTFLGNVRLGRLMEDMDMFAVWVTSKHILNPRQQAGVPTPYVLVTVLVDQIDFTDVLPRSDADIRLSGHVSWVGRSSIETVVWLEQEAHGEWKKLTRAVFLMAARNSINSGPAFVNPLQPATEYEREIYEGGEDRNKRRRLQQKESLLKRIPNEMEQQVIHDIFINTVDLSDPTYHKRQLPSQSVWMDDATISNYVFCHPEDRNLHNKVFGGFLMRQALELSWTAGYLYSKYRPKLHHISNIAFHKPVDVASLLRMHAFVIYTESMYMQILVHAEVLDISGKHSTTNHFQYTYSLPSEVNKIIPRSYNDAMLYLDGRRRFKQVMGLTK